MYLKVIFATLLVEIMGHHVVREYKDWSKINNDLEGYHVYNLYMSESNFTQINYTINSNYLEITDSSCSTLPAVAFENSDSILVLHLVGININKISPRAFHGLPYLQQLNLSKNELTEVVDGVFNELTELQYLDLSFNYIKNVSRASFTELTKLRELYLHNNRISFLDDSVTLDLSSNRLADVGGAFHGLSSNQFTQVNSMFKNLNKLSHLELQYNNISVIMPDSLVGLESLEYLNLSHNNLKEFRYGIFSHVGFLQSLDMSYNQITKLPVLVLNPLRNLKNIFLSHNHITGLQITDILEHLPSVRQVDVDKNFNWSCPKLSRALKSLQDKGVDIVKGRDFAGDNMEGISCYNSEEDITNKSQMFGVPEEKDNNIEKLVNLLGKLTSDANIRYPDKVVSSCNSYSNAVIILLIAINGVLILFFVSYLYFKLKSFKRNGAETVELF